MKKIIDERYEDKNLSLEGIAQELDISAIYLGRQFKTYMARSVADYISEFRIEKAADLIRSTSLSIHHIANRVGFCNNSYFSTIFKKTYGMTPNEYRRKNQTLLSE